MLFTEDGKAKRDIEIDNLRIFFGGVLGKKIILTKEKATVKNTVSLIADREIYPEEYFEEREISLTKEKFLQISDDLHNAGLLDILDVPKKCVNIPDGGICSKLVCTFTDGATLVYETYLSPVKKFEKISEILSALFKDFTEEYEVPYLETEESIKEKIFKETACCHKVISESFSYCPVCGKKLQEEDKLPTEQERDLFSTTKLCSECYAGIDLEDDYCGYCGKKFEW